MGRHAGGSKELHLPLTHPQVSYADVFALVKGIMEGPPHRLLESLAHTIAQRVLQEHTSIHSVRVAVSKLHIPALSAAVGSVGACACMSTWAYKRARVQVPCLTHHWSPLVCYALPRCGGVPPPAGLRCGGGVMA